MLSNWFRSKKRKEEIASKIAEKEANLDSFIASNSHFTLHLENDETQVQIASSVNGSDMDSLLEFLWEEDFEIAFHDTIHPTISDPGAYFSYSNYKARNRTVWSMTYGNHGWTGGIYHIRSSTVSKQLMNLIKKDKINMIQITGVVFFSKFELETPEKSEEKNMEISQMHD